MPDRLPIIAVVSSSGGAGKTAVSAMLSQKFTSNGLDMALCDATLAVGVSALRPPTGFSGEKVQTWDGEGNTVPFREVSDNLAAVKISLPHLDRAAMLTLRNFAFESGHKALLIDTPVTSHEHLSPILTYATAIIYVMPNSLAAFRRSQQFLTGLKEERAKPGRLFSTGCVLNKVDLSSQEGRATFSFLQTHLAPILLKSYITENADIRQSMVEGLFPQGSSDSDLEMQVSNLYDEIMEILNAKLKSLSQGMR